MHFEKRNNLRINVFGGENEATYLFCFHPTEATKNLNGLVYCLLVIERAIIAVPVFKNNTIDSQKSITEIELLFMSFNIAANIPRYQGD